MNIIKDTTEYSFSESVIMLGKFDGVHLGHQELIRTGVTIAKEKGLSPIVYTFEGISTECLTTDEEKVGIFQSLGVEHTVFEKFTDEFKSIMPCDFVKNILAGILNAKHIVVGFNYRFGKDATGDVNLLKELCNECGIFLTVIPPYEIDGATVSSTRIRNLLANGDVKDVKKFLGRHYSISGVTVMGKGLGHTLGFATANLVNDMTKLIPKRGVYITNTIVDGIAYQSMTNVGLNPTVENIDVQKVETHIINYHAELYGESIQIEFIDFMRDEKMFNSVDELKSQLMADREHVREYFKEENIN